MRSKLVPVVTAGLLLVGLLAFIPTVDAAAGDVTRSFGFGLTTVECNSFFDVIFTVETIPQATGPGTPSSRFWGIDDTFPAGWTVTSSTGGGAFVFPPFLPPPAAPNTPNPQAGQPTGQVKWFGFDSAGRQDQQVQYTIAVPPSIAPGTYNFNGIYTMEGKNGGAETPIVGVNSIEVTCPGFSTSTSSSGTSSSSSSTSSSTSTTLPPPPPGTGQVTRALPGATNCGSTFVVFLQVDVPTGSRQWGIDEEYPAGWTVISTSPGASLADPGHVKWLKFDAANGVFDETVFYTIQVPPAFAGTATFAGVFTADPQPTNDTAILGPTQLNVGCGGGVAGGDKPGGGFDGGSTSSSTTTSGGGGGVVVVTLTSTQVITITPKKDGGAPGLGLVGLAAALGVGLLLARRKIK